jgi:hypothetical protein
LVFERPPLFFFFSCANTSDLKHSKHGAEDIVASNDATTRHSMPSVVVELSLNVARHAAGAPLRQTSALAGKLATTSTLGAARAPKVLKIKKLNVKKKLHCKYSITFILQIL